MNDQELIQNKYKPEDYNQHLYFLNSFYVKPKLEKLDDGSYKLIQDDFLMMCIKHCDTNETELKFVDKPQIDYYVVKDKSKYTYPMMSIGRDEVIRRTCAYSEREMSQIKDLGLMSEWIETCRLDKEYGTREKGPWKIHNLVNSPFLYKADYDVEDYYKNLYMEKYGRDIYHHYGCIKRSHFDIEADQFFDNWNIDDHTAPINSMTFLDKNTNTLYALELENQPDNPDMKWVKENPDEFWKQEVLPLIDPENKYKVDYKYVIKFYKNEVDLLKAYWDIIHLCKPDFCGIWNMNFDIPYIIARMEKLGIPLEYACHPDVPSKYRYFKYKADRDRGDAMSKVKVDSGDENKHPSRLWDWCYISGYTQFYDQMALYSLIRKRFILPSYKLDDIASEETGYRKVEYHNKGYTIRKLAHQNYKLFLAYSIIDTIRLDQIELEADDLHRSIIFADNTKMEVSQKISYVIKNKMMRYYLDNVNKETGKHEERVIGNNVTYNVKEKISGAIIADPTNLRIRGKGVLKTQGFVYDDVVDFDEASEYPRIILNFNISKNSIFGRICEITFPNQEPIKLDNDVKHLLGDINKLLQTRKTSIFEIGTRYFGLPTPETIMEEIEKAYDEDAKKRIEIKNKE